VLVQTPNSKLAYSIGGRISTSHSTLAEATLSIIPPPWGPMFETAVVPRARLYDMVARTLNSQFSGSIHGFARIAEDGATAILHQFPADHVYPAGSSLVYGPDLNIYGIATQQLGAPRMFIFRFTFEGAYSQLLSFPAYPNQRVPPPLVAASDGEPVWRFL